jgi:prolyl-tRNA editing enzyme YbaK/EbsC (Cys-tRNA(Pro) deacylase)
MATRLEDLLVEFAVRQFPAGTRTAQDAALAIGCSLGQIVKSLVFVAGGRPVVALVSGSNRLDPLRLAQLAGEPVAKADADLTRASTGYAIGGVPPFGHVQKLPVFVDRDLLRFDIVWAAAGRPDSVFAVVPSRLLELSGGELCDLKEPGTGTVGTSKIEPDSPPPDNRAGRGKENR